MTLEAGIMKENWPDPAIAIICDQFKFILSRPQSIDRITFELILRFVVYIHRLSFHAQPPDIDLLLL